MPFIPLALIAALAGFVYLFRRSKAMFLFLSLIIAADVIYCLGYEIDEDKDAYYLPAFIALTVAAAFAMRWYLTAMQATRLQTKLMLALSAISLSLIPITALASNFGFGNRSHYYIAHDYVDNILKTVEPRGLLLTTDWQVYSPFLYVREIEQARRDAVVVDINQLRRSWYFDYLKQAYPELIANSRQEVDNFLEDLRHWEQDPEIYNRDVTLNQRINRRFYDMILSFVANQIKSAPVYITEEIGVSRNSQDAELTTALNQKYKIVPQGLIFRVAEQTENPGFTDAQIQTRGLGDNTLKFADDDVVKKKVLPVYLTMLTNTGLYLASQNQHERAVEWFKQAIAIDSGYEPARRFLASSQTALQKQTATKAP